MATSLGPLRQGAQERARPSHQIDVDQLELLPEDNSGRPSTDTLLGIGADWLDGMTVDDFLRVVRRG